MTLKEQGRVLFFLVLILGSVVVSAEERGFLAFGLSYVPRHNAQNAAFVHIDDVAIIPLGDVQRAVGGEDALHRAYQFVFENLRTTSSRFVIYPKSFAYNGTTFSQGAIINLNPNGLPENGESDYFFHLESEAGIDLSESMALYDHNIAVLRAEGSIPPSTVKTDLTWESAYFCDALQQYLGIYEECWTVERYKEHSPSGTNFIFVSPEDINEDFLAQNAVGLLILPDIQYGSDTVILDRLNVTADGQSNTGIEKIYSFVESGAMVLASAKGARIAEGCGLLLPGTVNENYMLTASDGSVYGYPTGSTTWEEIVVGFSVPTTGGRRVNNLYNTFFLDLSIEQAVNPTKISVIANFEDTGLMKITPSGVQQPLLPAETPQPMTVHKIVGNGQVVLNQAQPQTVHSADCFSWFYNLVWLSMSRQMVVDYSTRFDVADQSQLIGRSGLTIIPGLETDILVTCSAELINLYDQQMSNTSLAVYIRQGLEPFNSSLPVFCSVDTGYVPNTYWAYRLLCDVGNVGNHEKIMIEYKVKIVDPLFTQAKYYLTVSAIYISYIDAEGAEIVNKQVGWLQVHGLMAALLRVDVNPDPSSFYPLVGRGVYMDNVVPAENKEDTRGCNISFISIVPIISPLTDISDQGGLAHKIELFDKYYTAAYNQLEGFDYIFPFEVVQSDHDILDYQRLSSIQAVLAADWDTPVKIFKYPRTYYTSTPVVGATNVSDVVNAQMSTNIESLGTVLKQLYFGEGWSDNYYEHATQRQLVYVDTSGVVGASTYFEGSIPPEWLNTRRQSEEGVDVARRKLFFVRNDVYFYDQGTGENYPLPKGMSDVTTVFSIDRYVNPTPIPCTPGTGNQRSQKVRPGYFDYTQPGGILPNEWSNELAQDCGRNWTHFNDIDALGYDGVKTSQYLFPLDGDVDSRDFYGFDYGGGGNCLENYTEVCIVRALAATFLVSPDVSRKGGKLVIPLPGGLTITPSGGRTVEEMITFSADQVAFYKTVVQTGASLTIEAYFVRGNMPNEAYGKDSVITVSIEGAAPTTDFSSSMSLYAMLYDFTGDAATGYRNYDEFSSSIVANFSLSSFLSLPSIVMSFEMSTFGESDNCVDAYRWFEPFARYGVYMQELENHATVWGSAEVHHISDAGFTTRSGGQSSITHIGSSSIPFREYLTTGPRQAIPHSSQTSRMEWTDIWGRRWGQPVRSVFFDYPPIPPPLRNFMMSTTFEILDPTTGDRMLEWASDQSIDVRVQMKLLNNYPKYFEITTCKANEKVVLRKEGMRYRIFDTSGMSFYAGSEDDHWVSYGHLSQYGSCIDADGTRLEGVLLSPAERTAAASAEFCDPDVLATPCVPPGGSPKIVMKDPIDPPRGTQWMYLPLVEQYYPADYIQSNMWDMTHYDYDDTAFDKSYKYHMDNNLPDLDKTSGGLLRPHNVIAAPIWKGLGYSVSYDKTYVQPRFGRGGWWSDNLQNRDDTLFAQQTQSNQISVDKELLLSDADWIEIGSLADTASEVPNVLGNIYCCEFNRMRPLVDPISDRGEYMENVYINNVVPIPPYLEKNDPHLTSYPCNTSSAMYTPETIHFFDNYVATDSARDWLYFASNLRGGAKETINLILNINLLSSATVPVEQLMTKVFDGGRFVYWNPANGPNSFLIVDDPVNVVESIRNDPTVTVEIFPSQVSTLHPVVYHVLELQDIPEIGRTLQDEVFNKHYGFGDSSVSVYVGGVGGTSMKLSPGEMTYAKVDLTNNCGFDWDLKKDAIIAEDLDQAPLSANDLLFRIQNIVQKPTEYRFLEVVPPPELAPYVTITPSDHNIRTAPLFFDFPYLNVLRIRDGFRGVYYFNITLSPSLPSSLRGQMFELSVNLKTEYFDRLPGCTGSIGGTECYDPVTTTVGSGNPRLAPVIHDYTLSVPSFKIGIPNLVGDVYYTSGYATNLWVDHSIPSPLMFSSAAHLPTSQLNYVRQISVNGVASGNATQDLDEFFDTLSPHLGFKIFPQTSGALKMSLCVTDLMNEHKFPSPTTPGLPDDAQFFVMVKTYAEYLNYGTQTVSEGTPARFVDWQGQDKTSEPWRSMEVSVRGPWIVLTYAGVVISENSGEPKKAQYIMPEMDGTISLTVSGTNIGSDVGYNVSYGLELPSGIEVLSCTGAFDMSQIPLSLEGDSLLMVSLPGPSFVTPGIPRAVTCVLKYHFNPNDHMTSNTTSGWADVLFVRRTKPYVAQSDDVGAQKVALDGIGPFSVARDIGPVLQLIPYPKPPTSVFLTAVPQFGSQDVPITPDMGYSFYRREVNNGKVGDWALIGDGHQQNAWIDSSLETSTKQKNATVQFFATLDEDLGVQFITQSQFQVVAESSVFTHFNIDDKKYDWWIIFPLLFVILVPSILMFAFTVAAPKPPALPRAAPILEPEVGWAGGVVVQEEVAAPAPVTQPDRPKGSKGRKYTKRELLEMELRELEEGLAYDFVIPADQIPPAPVPPPPVPAQRLPTAPTAAALKQMPGFSH